MCERCELWERCELCERWPAKNRGASWPPRSRISFCFDPRSSRLRTSTGISTGWSGAGIGWPATPRPSIPRAEPSSSRRRPLVLPRGRRSENVFSIFGSFDTGGPPTPIAKQFGTRGLRAPHLLLDTMPTSLLSLAPKIPAALPRLVSRPSASRRSAHGTTSDHTEASPLSKPSLKMAPRKGTSADHSGPAGLPPNWRVPWLGPPAAPELSPIRLPVPSSKW